MQFNVSRLPCALVRTQCNAAKVRLVYLFTSVLLTFALCNIWLQVVLARRGKKFLHALTLGFSAFQAYCFSACLELAFVFHRSLPFTTLLLALCKLSSSSFDRGGSASHGPGAVLSVWMQPDSPEAGTLHLISRLQHLLAVYRLWLHELRGRLDSFH